MKITEIYSELSALNLVRSQMEFSRIWLGRSPRYYSHLLARKKEPGIATLAGLLWRLKGLAHSMTKTEQGTALGQLAHDLHLHIEQRSIVDIRRRN